MCPKVSESTYYMLWKYYPEQWEWMKKEEKKLRKLEKHGDLPVFNKQFNKDKTLKNMEKQFKESSYNVTLRKTEDSDFCFCVI